MVTWQSDYCNVPLQKDLSKSEVWEGMTLFRFHSDETQKPPFSDSSNLKNSPKKSTEKTVIFLLQKQNGRKESI